MLDQSCIYLIKTRKNSNFEKSYYYFKMCDGKAEFSATLLDPSEIRDTALLFFFFFWKYAHFTTPN